jgi:hypothetical protein
MLIYSPPGLTQTNLHFIHMAGISIRFVRLLNKHRLFYHRTLNGLAQECLLCSVRDTKVSPYSIIKCGLVLVFKVLNVG